ncbi:MAG: hypothetical protein K2G03_04795 [Bacilli bacterium]|nr:hypothetical protein [Bacilli bacterium]
MKYQVLKWGALEKRIKRIDVIDYALSLVDYVIDSGDKLDNDFLFMSKFAIDYLINNPLLIVGGESRSEKLQCEDKMQELSKKAASINFSKKVNSFDEFITCLYFPRVVTEKDASEVISRKEFYENSDDLYRTMQLSVVSPNSRLLRAYNKHYKRVKLEYIKMIANVVERELNIIDFELNEADKQFVQLCKMINKYLTPNEDDSYYDTAKGYLEVSMNLMLQKIRENNK